MNPNLLPLEVQSFLRSGGWAPSRSARSLVSRWKQDFFENGEFYLSPLAEGILLELGGLSFDQSGPGETVARSSFFFDPTVAEGESDRFADFEKVIGARLCPVGEADDGYSYLAVAEDGRMLCLMDDGWIIGKSIEEGLVALVVGRKGQEIFTDPK